MSASVDTRKRQDASVSARTSPHNLLTACGLACVAAYSTTLLYATARTSYDVWGALVIAPVLVAVTVPVVRRIVRRDGDMSVLPIIVVALLLKLLASLVRFLIGFEVYDGSIDARQYLNFGEGLATAFRSGVFDVELGRDQLIGTSFTQLLTGVVLAVIGPTDVGAFLVFGWMAFWGQLLLYRAFRVAVPGGEHRRYAVLVLCLPSLLYWPASVGKDAWMILGLGLAAYGLARILTRARGGYALVAVGITATALVRPHISALFCAAMLVAYALRSTSGAGRLSVGKVVGLVALTFGLLLVVQQAEEYFGIEESTPEAVAQVVDEAARRTAAGGSQYEARRPRSLLEVPRAAFDVVFRPLPHEAHNVQALLAALEGMLLLGLFLWSIPRLVDAPVRAWRNPYIAFALIYALGFAVAFSSFGNFGILARQRVQLLPFVLVLLALPARRRLLEQRRMGAATP